MACSDCDTQPRLIDDDNIQNSREWNWQVVYEQQFNCGIHVNKTTAQCVVAQHWVRNLDFMRSWKELCGTIRHGEIIICLFAFLLDVLFHRGFQTGLK